MSNQSCCCGESEEKTTNQDASCCCENATEKAANQQSCCCGGGEGETNDQQSCCCGDDSSEGCCETSVYSCEDEPYKGHKKTVVVDFLFLDLSVCDRCQGTDERVYQAVERCRDVLSACGYNLILNQIDIENEELAQRYRFYSSPTVRVDGVDVCPSIEENNCDCCREISDYDVKCRVFPFNDTYYEVPPTDMLVRNIINTVIKGIKPEPETEPYVLPENLAGFFEGKRKKAAEKAAGAVS